MAGFSAVVLNAFSDDSVVGGMGFAAVGIGGLLGVHLAVRWFGGAGGKPEEKGSERERKGSGLVNRDTKGGSSRANRSGPALD